MPPMPLNPASLAAITRYWASFFGCPVAALDQPGVRVLPHAELEAYRGILVFHYEATTLVSVPPDQVARWEALLAGLPSDALLDPARMTEVASVPPAQVIGPAVVAYADGDARS
jgi:hypothetical protein